MVVKVGRRHAVEPESRIKPAPPVFGNWKMDPPGSHSCASPPFGRVARMSPRTLFFRGFTPANLRIVKILPRAIECGQRRWLPVHFAGFAARLFFNISLGCSVACIPLNFVFRPFFRSTFTFSPDPCPNRSP
jgi:hypothetical protein